MDKKPFFAAIFLVFACIVNAGARSADHYLKSGIEQDSFGNYSAAVGDYTKAIGLNPDLAEAYCKRAASNNKLGAYKSVIDDCGRALELDHKMAEAYVNRAYAEMTFKNINGAIGDCTKAIKIRPGYAEAYHERAKYRHVAGDYNGCVKDSTAAINIDPGLFDSYVERALAERELGDIQGALKDYNTVINMALEKARSISIRATSETKHNAHARAAGDYTLLLDLLSQVESSTAFRGRLYASDLHDEAAAAGDSAAGSKYAYKIMKTYINRGLVKMSMKDTNGAIPDFDRAAGDRKDNDVQADAYFYRAQCEEKNGDKDKALDDYKSAEGLGNTMATEHLKNADKTNATTSGGTSFEKNLSSKIFALVNDERVKYGLKPLKMSQKLSEIAKEHSADMAKRDYTSHITPEGLSPTDRAKKAGFKTEIVYADRIRKGVGENLAMHQEGVEENGVKSYYLKGVDETARILVDGWMNSPGHRANILNSDYTMVGTGVAVSSDKKVLATQMFF